MKRLILISFLLIFQFSFSQENEEFLPIVIEGQDAFLSTKTGEYVFLDHDNTNPKELKTTASGVVYNDIKIHEIKKGETLSKIAKQYNVDVNQLMEDNDLSSKKLDLNQKLKIIIKKLIPSSSPTISYSGDERIVARLQPGQSPSTLSPPPVNNKPNATTNKSAQNTLSKPILIPNTSENNETDEVKKAKLELLEAQKKLEEAKLKASKENQLPEYHTIKKNETFYSIAKQYNLTVQELKQLNKVDINNLKIGQKIKLR